MCIRLQTFLMPTQRKHLAILRSAMLLKPKRYVTLCCQALNHVNGLLSRTTPTTHHRTNRIEAKDKIIHTSIRRIVLRWILSVFVFAVCVASWVLKPQRHMVSGLSMAPTFSPGDIVSSGWCPYIDPYFAPQRFECWFLITPDGTPIIKRLFGLPGETIRFSEATNQKLPFSLFIFTLEICARAA